LRISFLWSENQRLLELDRLRDRCFSHAHVCFFPPLSYEGWRYNHFHHSLVAWDIMRRLVQK
jgi:hypothetical protein